SVTFHTRKLNFQIRAIRQRMNVLPLHWRRWGRLLPRLERNDLERYAKHIRNFLPQSPVGIEIIVIGSPQASADYLLTQQLGHKRAQPDDVGHSAAIPSF